MTIALRDVEGRRGKIGGTAHLSPPGMFGDLPVVIEEGSVFDSGPIAPGIYKVSASMPGINGSKVIVSKVMETKVVAAKTTQIDVPVYRARRIVFEWRFRELEAQQKTPWIKGESSFATGTSVFAPESWKRPGHFWLGDISPWIDGRCTIQGMNPRIARVSARKLPEGSQSPISSDEPTRDPIPIAPRAIYWLIENKFEAFMQVKSITPLTAPEPKPASARIDSPEADQPGPIKSLKPIRKRLRAS